MSSGAPHTYPLRRGGDLLVAGAIAVEVFALVRVSPWFPLAWCAVLAVAVGAAAFPRPRAGEVLLSLGLRLALYFAACGFAGLLIAGMVHAGWTPLTYPRADPVLNALAGAFWLWALHAPLAMSRWWVRARPAQDAALEVAEALGLSLVATVLALSAQNHERAWSFALGTAWSTGLCAALGVALVGWAWVAQGRRRAWMRRVLADRDPAWHLVAADDTAAAAEPWTHAGAGDAAPRVLAPRGDDTHYRASQLRVTVARVGARDGVAWWVRRALNVAAAGWSFALLGWGVWHLLHVLPPDHERDLYARIATMQVWSDPCTDRERRWGRGAHRGFWLPEGRSAELWESGVVMGVWIDRGRREYTARPDWQRCIDVAAARRWINDPRAGNYVTREAVIALEMAPSESTPAASPGRCERGHWRAISWVDSGRAQDDYRTDPITPRRGFGCAMDSDGGWWCTVEATDYARVDPGDARAVLAGVERLAHERGLLRARPNEGVRVEVCGRRGASWVTFPGERELGEVLARKLGERSWR